MCRTRRFRDIRNFNHVRRMGDWRSEQKLSLRLSKLFSSCCTFALCHSHDCFNALDGRRKRPTSLALKRLWVHRLHSARREDVAEMSASVFGSVSGTSKSVPTWLLLLWLLSLTVFIVIHSCLIPTLVAPAGSLNLRCLNCVFVSYVCSGVLRSLPVRVHPTQAIERCFGSFLNYDLSFA